MTDQIQDLLQRFHLAGERRALARAFSALRVEFAGPVARFLREAPTSLIVEQVLCDLLVDLLGVTTDSRLRAMAPDDHNNPVAWRRHVLLNALRDRSRRARSYDKAVTAQGAEVAVTSVETPDTEQQIELRQQRQRVVALLPRLDIRRRAAVALEIGLELPMVWIEELANHLGISWSELLTRLRNHEAAPHDEECKLRVIYGPEHPQRTARDAYRQTVSRACAELRQLLDRGRS